jgi:hypothetical protein
MLCGQNPLRSVRSGGGNTQRDRDVHAQERWSLMRARSCAHRSAGRARGLSISDSTRARSMSRGPRVGATSSPSTIDGP